MCFSNANFRNIYFHRSLSISILQVPISRGRKPCLGLVDFFSEPAAGKTHVKMWFQPKAERIRWYFAECKKCEPLLLQRAWLLYHKSHLWHFISKGQLSHGEDKSSKLFFLDSKRDET